MFFSLFKYKILFSSACFIILVIVVIKFHANDQFTNINNLLSEQPLNFSTLDYNYDSNEEINSKNLSADDFSQQNLYKTVNDAFFLESTFITNITDSLNFYSSKLQLPKYINDDQIIVINETGILKKRIQKFNEYLSIVRFKILQQKGFKEWSDVNSPNKIKVVWGNTENFLQKLADADKNVINILLPWHSSINRKFSGLKERQKLWNGWDSRNDMTNMLINSYHTWTGSEQLCEWIARPAFTKAHWDAVYNRTCSTNILDSKNNRSIEFVYFHSKPINIAHYYPNNGLFYPDYFYKQPPRSIIYISIFRDAIINLNGDVISGGIKAVPYTCSHDFIPTIPNEYRETNIFSEVFVVTQFWGASYFHFTLEVLPRISPFLEFLLNNTQIFIHSPTGDNGGKLSEFFEILGIKKERLVTGVIRAKTLYLPHATPCGFALVHELQLLSHYYRSFIKKSFTLNKRNRLILIKRTGSRRFLMHAHIESELRLFSKRKKFLFTLFEDNPSPSLNITMKLFNEAAIIIGPHGAGLSNIIFSEPNTLVIEGVCNPPHVNMCYQRIAHILGHYYHGISSINGCENYINIISDSIIEALNKYLLIIDHF